MGSHQSRNTPRSTMLLPRLHRKYQTHYHPTIRASAVDGLQMAAQINKAKESRLNNRRRVRRSIRGYHDFSHRRVALSWTGTDLCRAWTRGPRPDRQHKPSNDQIVLRVNLSPRRAPLDNRSERSPSSSTIDEEREPGILAGANFLDP